MIDYDTDYDSLPELLTPEDDKTPEGLAFTQVLLNGVKTLHARFMAYREQTLFRLKFTGQVCYLEKVLNIKFNGGLPAYTGTTPTGIYISDGAFIDQKFRWNAIEGRMDGYRWNDAELTADPSRRLFRYGDGDAAANVDFIVHIPTACGSVSDVVFASSVKAWVNYYRQAGKRFSLVNY